MAAALLFAFAGNAIGALYGLYAIRELGLPPALLGVVISLGGVGALAGSFAAGRASRWLGVGPSVALGLLGYGLSGLLIPFAAGPVALAAAMLAASQLLDGLHSVYAVNEVSLRQSITPDRLRGRVNATAHLLVLGVGPLGAIAGAALAESYGIRTTLLLAVAGVIAAGVLLLASPVRHVRALAA